MSSGESPPPAPGLSKEHAHSHNILYCSTNYLIVTSVHCSLSLSLTLNHGLLEVKGHALFTLHLLAPEESLAGSVWSLTGLPVTCHDQHPEGKGRWGAGFVINPGRHVDFCLLVLNCTVIMRNGTWTMHLVLLPRRVKHIWLSTLHWGTSYPVENVWRQIQGPFPYHSSLPGVLSHRLGLQKCPMWVRASGKTLRRPRTQMTAPSGG